MFIKKLLHCKGFLKEEVLMMSNFFSPSPGKTKPLAVRGQGIYLYDENGKQYIDGSSGAMTVNLGHCNPEITEKIKNQLNVLTFTYRSQFTNEPLEELCKKIADFSPGDLNHVSLVNSGSEATEMGMKLAASYWNVMGKPGKKRILSGWCSYHGSTIGALSMTGNPGRRREYQEYLSDYPVLESAYCHRCPYEKKYPGCGLFCAQYLEKIITRFGSETISALILEPVIGASGAGITPPDGYFEKIRGICSRNNILLILDEVITGFGRTGKNFAMEHWNVVPDILVFGKGVSCGYGAVAGINASSLIYDAFVESKAEFSTGHTFSGNPLAAAGSNAVLDYLIEHQVVEQAEKMGKYFLEKLNELQKNSMLVDDIRGKGLLWGVEIVRDKNTHQFFPVENQISAKLVSICFENGLLVYPSAGFIDGKWGDSILLSPPLVITREETNQLFDILEKSLQILEKQVL